MPDEATPEQVVELGRRILLRMRSHGCNCLPVIEFTREGEYWFADVSHEKHCPHEWPDEYLGPED